jgi:hypothetical protein
MNNDPHQEWELFLLWKQEFELYLKFASDISCPKENFFLNLLYYWVWRNIKHELSENELSQYQNVFEQADKINSPYVKLWLERTNKLINDKNCFDEDEWWSDRRPYDVES